MISSRVSKIQSGSALVLSLLILLVMTIVGVAAMSNIHMQERMAGNVNVQSLSFEAASAGISQALEFGLTEEEAQGGCERDDGPWNGSYDDFTPIRITPMAGQVQNLTIEYLLKADCLEDPVLVDLMEDASLVPPQLYVTSLGRVTSGDGAVLATREIEVRIDDFRTDGLSGMRIEGEAEVSYGASNSNRFTMDGHGGPAISTSTRENASIISDQIGDDRLGNYGGGVAASQYPPPFNNAAAMAEFVRKIKAYMQYRGIGSTPVPICGTYPDGDPVTMAFHAGDYELAGGVTTSGINYVQGNLTQGGNPQGTGLIIVEGAVNWHGTTQFQGLVIGLNGEFRLSGGGTGQTRGMLYIADLALDQLDWYSGNPRFTGFEDIDKSDPVTNPWFNEYDGDGNLLIEGILEQINMDPDPLDVQLPFFRLYSGCNANNWPGCLDSTTDDGFGPSNIQFDGGGSHSIEYECGLFDDQRIALSQCVTTLGEYARLDEPWQDAGCNVPGRGGSIQAIRSWRENLGWREQLD